jgi:phosphatidylglycerophosphatase A
MTRVAVWVATVGGAGYSPVASGTVGSAVGVALYWVTRHWPIGWQVLLLVAVSAIGTWAASRAALHFQQKDPGRVVIDEVAGQLATLIATGADLRLALLGFLVFRALDIVKPPPARMIDRDWHHGFGVMADDIVAALYALLVLALWQRLFL